MKYTPYILVKPSRWWWSPIEGNDNRVKRVTFMKYQKQPIIRKMHELGACVTEWYETGLLN